MKSEPVVLWSSILVTLQVIVAGSVLTDVLGPNIAALVALIVAALQAGTQFYIRGQVTPVDLTPRPLERGATDIAYVLVVCILAVVLIVVLSRLL